MTCPRKGFINSALALFHIKLSLSIGRESPFKISGGQYGGVEKRTPAGANDRWESKKRARWVNSYANKKTEAVE